MEQEIRQTFLETKKYEFVCTLKIKSFYHLVSIKSNEGLFYQAKVFPYTKLFKNPVMKESVLNEIKFA